ncbi:MAG: subclass B3 metallo-beta-lactamase [Rhizobacter sp.]|nr:subclass B3 metallo-beta-lactamase [Ferruginibacter sp.]
MKQQRHYFLLFIFVIFSLVSTAQEVKEPPVRDSSWIKNYEPFRIAGNLYYVGTYDLSSYLITTNAGNILINTGLASSAVQIKNNIEQLGFKFNDTKIILTTQAHYDHMGAMAAIQKQTGAKFYVSKGDAVTAASGGAADYEMGKYGATYQPLKAAKKLKDGSIVKLGTTALKVLSHPGHTMGSCSYLLTVNDSGKSYKVLIANMPSIITDRRFEEITAYPAISKDYAKTLQVMKNIDFDLWVASHASQFELHKKHQPGDPYNPGIFNDKKAYIEYLNEFQKAYDDKIKKDVAERDEKAK